MDGIPSIVKYRCLWYGGEGLEAHYSSDYKGASPVAPYDESLRKCNGSSSRGAVINVNTGTMGVTVASTRCPFVAAALAWLKTV